VSVYKVDEEVDLVAVRNRYLAAASHVVSWDRCFLQPMQSHPSRRVRANAIALHRRSKEMIEESTTIAHDIEILRLIELDGRESSLWRDIAADLRARMARWIASGSNPNQKKSPGGVLFAEEGYTISMDSIRKAFEPNPLTETIVVEAPEIKPVTITDEDLEIDDRMIDLSMELERYEQVVKMAENCIELVQLLRSDPLELGGVPEDAHAPAVALCLIPHSSVEVFL
jgi:hypothetical protein